LNEFGILLPNPMLLPFLNPATIQKFSKREKICLYHLVRGKTIKEIASALYRSPKTIETHIEHMKLKLNCQTRSELITKILEPVDISDEL